MIAVMINLIFGMCEVFDRLVVCVPVLIGKNVFVFLKRGKRMMVVLFPTSKLNLYNPRKI